MPTSSGVLTILRTLRRCRRRSCLLPATAQDWPTRAVRIVSPFAAGGSSDTVGRVIGESLSEKFWPAIRAGEPRRRRRADRLGAGRGCAARRLHVPDLVDRHPRDRAADLGQGGLRSGDELHQRRRMSGGPPIVIVVHPSLGVKSLAELLALLKKQPEPMPYVSPGPGTLGHLVGEYWAEKEKVRPRACRLQGLRPGDERSRRRSCEARLAHLDRGARPDERRHGHPDRGVVGAADAGLRGRADAQELGYADMAVTTWFGFAAPAGLPAAIAQQMNNAIGARSTIRRPAGVWWRQASSSSVCRRPSYGLHQGRSRQMGAARQAADSADANRERSMTGNIRATLAVIATLGLAPAAA